MELTDLRDFHCMSVVLIKAFSVLLLQADATEISSSECLMLFLLQDCSFDSLGISSVAVYLVDMGNAQMF